MSEISLAIKRMPRLYDLLRTIYSWVTGFQGTNWSRVVMNRETLRLVQDINPSAMKVLEISGDFWKTRCLFKEYKNVNYPDYDICSSVLPEKFDLIIAEQVFEHILWPYRAGKNIYEMLNKGGYFLITTPFLVRIHEGPHDCTRWTETGIKYLLNGCGFHLDDIVTGSWGNRSCVVADFKGWTLYKKRLHSLKNELNFPYVVWALARR